MHGMCQGVEMEKLNALKKFFGYDSFVAGQEDLVDHILNGIDTLGVMPTGAGKSICYQLPALIFDGITLVISPLISLMKDQVNSLNQAGISAAYLNSSLSYGQYAKALQNAAADMYKIIYVAPERLQTQEFLSFARNIKIAMVAIDEAHCVSQWGQDFRPSYLKVAQFIDGLPARPVVSAFTATATSKVRDDIVDKLKLNTPYVLTTGFDRKNLHFSVSRPKDKLAELKQYLKGKENKFGIVYCSTRKAVDEVCARLISTGFNATKYHAGLSEKERRENQDLFIYDDANIMVATNAFGMGIDKSNVSFVIHYNMPKNMESYYQEAGRAGRDGEPAECLLFYSGQDVITNQFLIENTSENEELDEDTIAAVKEKDRQLLKLMTFYCHTNDCLREYILNYFGERTSNYCGNCSNCGSNFEEADVTEEARKIISCIKESGGRFGIKMITDILRGSKNQRLISNRLHFLPTYASMTDCTESKIRDIMNFLCLQGFLEITDSEYPVVRLAKSASKVLLEDSKVKMKILKEYRQFGEEEPETDRGMTQADKTIRGGSAGSAKQSKKSKQSKYSKQAKDTDARLNTELFENLRLLRNRIAADQHVPAYIVFSDATLWDMCRKLPMNQIDFMKVNGVGQTKLERYGEMFIDKIRKGG
jgi:ATP-dependent DNA helicase RecQ